jgi:hypothetical protein
VIKKTIIKISTAPYYFSQCQPQRIETYSIDTMSVITKYGDLYSPYPALPYNFRR